MKSAFELAMERLDKASGPTKKLTAKQKADIAEIEKKIEAGIAEIKLSFEPRFAGAKDLEEFNALQQGLADKIAALEARREKEKNAVWESD